MSAHLSAEMHQLTLKRIGKQPIRKMPQSGDWQGDQLFILQNEEDDHLQRLGNHFQPNFGNDRNVYAMVKVTT